MTEPLVLRESFAESLTERHHRQSFVGSILALLLLPTGVALDLTVYPEIFDVLGRWRIICEVLVACICALHLFEKSKDYARILSFGWALVVCVSMCLMIAASGDIYGPYYAGLSLLTLGITLILPLSLAEALLLTLMTVGGYVIIVIANHDGAGSIAQSVNNFYFLISTCFIACCASYFSSKRRFAEYKLNYELDLRTKQLAELDRVKSDFYANISHELRTPLTLILAPVEDLLAEKTLDSNVQTPLLYVRDNTYRLLKLVNDLLDVIKLEEKKDVLEQQPLEVNSLLSNIVSGMDALATQKVVELRFQPCDRPAVILGDESALEKVLINLINNAIKFTDAGGSVLVRLWVENSTVLIEIADTGVGIAETDLPKIFDRFSQGDSSATRKHQGTGLGLALVKELTELQNGNVRVQSTPEEGTVMTVEFPELKNVDLRELSDSKKTNVPADDDAIDRFHRQASFSISETKATKPLVAQEAEASDPAAFIGANLLIVEDEPDVRSYLAEALSSIYHVDIAVDGEEGLAKIKQNKPDLVLLDLMLPKLDGLSVCKQTKQDPACRQTKIILLTARTDEDSKMTALAHGADDFLTKPFSTIEIKTRLKNLWENSGLERDLSQRNTDLSSALTTLQDTQGQLIQSEKLNAIGRLAAGLLHEVNNPLNFAFGTFQILEREPKLLEDESLKEMMADIRVGMERISAIVKDLRSFAYPEKTDMQKVFSLRAAVDSALRLTSKKAHNTNVVANFEDNIALKGSQSHIIQVFVNLIENAVQAMESSNTENKQISIFVSDDPQQSSRTAVHVKDNGLGISRDKIDLIFDPFFTTKDVGEGMGMGLSIATTIITNHGGQLRVDSEEGSYTDFYFDLEKESGSSPEPDDRNYGDKACEI